MNFLKSAVISLIGITSSFAGSLNVIHFGPPEDINLEVKAGGASQKFTLARLNASGPFVLPNKSAVLRTIGDKIKSIDISSKKNGQIAVLQPKDDSFAWKLYSSKPTPGKVSLRVINVTAEKAELTIAGKKIEAPAQSDTTIDEVTKGPIRISFEGGKKQISHTQEEPSAVIAFIYKDTGEWHVLYVNDV